MKRGHPALLLAMLVACQTKRPTVGAGAQLDTTSSQDTLVRDTDGFLHQKEWTRTDSLLGELIREGHRHPLGITDPSFALLKQVRIGETRAGQLRDLLGPPTTQRATADSTIMEYASPFIGPDESVVFTVNGERHQVPLSQTTAIQVREAAPGHTAALVFGGAVAATVVAVIEVSKPSRDHLCCGVSWPPGPCNAMCQN